MPDPVAIRQVFNLPPEQAIAFLDSKGYRTSVDWTDTFNEEHDASFTVAKIAKVDLLRDIHVSLLDAMAEGKPFAQWQAELEPTLRDKGWLGKVQNEELTGTAETVKVGPRRLRTIYDTNIRMARSVGLWQRIQANKEALPFLRYSAVLDRRTRPQHRAWHAIILPVDHRFWLTHFPPNGWNCRCTVIQLSQRDLDRRGWQVTNPPPPLDDLVPFRRKGRSEVYQIPRGIDPGFGYNAGTARLRAVIEKTRASVDAAAQEGLYDVARISLRDIVDSPALEQFLADREPGIPVAVLSDFDAVALQSTTRVVTLTERSINHIAVENRRNYPAAVYRAMQLAIDDPLLKVAQDNGNMLYLYRVGSDLYALVVRSEPDSGELWAHTVFRVPAAQIGRLRRKGTVLIDKS